MGLGKRGLPSCLLEQHHVSSSMYLCKPEKNSEENLEADVRISIMKKNAKGFFVTLTFHVEINLTHSFNPSQTTSPPLPLHKIIVSNQPLPRFPWDILQEYADLRLSERYRF